MKSLYSSESAKNRILDLYDKKLVELNIPFKELDVETNFGRTHIISCGKEDAPPLLIIHGSNGCAPIGLESYPRLAEHFRVYAIDVLAQPNKSAETRLSMKDKSYGQWINELIDKLQLDSVTLAGFSFGGLIILKTLEYDESKIKRVYLAAPAYIVNGNPLKGIFQIFIPMLRYKRSKDIKFVEKFLAKVFSEKDPFALAYLSEVFLHFDMDFSPVPVIKTKDANKIKTEINLIAAGQDIMFPGRKMLERAKKIFPSLNQSVLLPESKHVQSKTDNQKIEEMIIEVLSK